MKTFRQFVITEGTKYVYHGTSSKTLDAIRKDGHIKPSEAGKTVHWSGPHPSKNGVYVSTHPHIAGNFAHMKAGDDKSEPVVLKLHRKALKGLKLDKELTQKSCYYHPKPVHASAIASVHSLKDHDKANEFFDHPLHKTALEHGFRHEGDSHGKNWQYRTYTRPGTQFKGKDYLHLGQNRHSGAINWESGQHDGKDEESLHRHLTQD